MGSGGMGKTSVSLAVIHDSRIVDVFGDNRYWIPCDKAHTITLLLEHLARMLAVSVESGNLLDGIMSHLKGNSVPRIFLLDNFETLWDSAETKDSSEDILSSLGSVSNNTILLTMRGSVLPLGVPWTKLPRPEIDRLSLNASRNTFKKHNQYYIDDQSDDLDDLLLALDCWPLAITLVARVGHSSKMKPSELLGSWEKEKTALLNIRLDRLESIDVSIRVSLHSLRSRQMDSYEDALTLLSVLACLPGGIMPEHLHRVAPTIQNVDAAKRQLLGASLAEYTPGGALAVLSPIRAYMLQYHPLNASDILALRKFYFLLVEAGKHDHGTQEFHAAFESLRREDSNIRSVLMNALENDTSVDAVQAAIHYSHYLYWDVPSAEVLDKAIGLIRKHPSPELDSLMPHCLLRLGMLFRRVDEFPRAVSNLNQAKEGFESLGDRGRTAECCLELAAVYMLLAKYPEAVDLLHIARDHFEAIDDQRGISDYLSVLGRVYHKQGYFTKASAVLIESQDICTTLGDRARVALRAHYLGIVYRTQGKLDESIKALDEAGAYFTTTFVAPYYVAENIYNHGVVYYLQQRYDQSDDALARAYDRFKLLGNHGMMTWCLFHQGELNLRRGRLEQASELFGMAKSKFEKMRWAQSIIDSLLGEARVFAALHQVADVHKSCSEALTIIGNQKGYENNILEIEELLHSSEMGG